MRAAATGRIAPRPTAALVVLCVAVFMAALDMARQLGLALGAGALVVIAGLGAAAGAANPLARGWWFAAGAAIAAGLAALRMTPRAALERA